MKSINEFLSTQVSNNYVLKKELADSVELDINIAEDAQQYLEDFDDIENNIRTALLGMDIKNMKFLKKVKVIVKVKDGWGTIAEPNLTKIRNIYTKIMNIYLAFNSDEFYKRWILDKNKNKWKIYGDSRPVIKNYVDKVDLLSVIQKALEYYEK